MRRSRFTHDQIVAVLREIDAGRKVTDVSTEYGLSTTTLYRWRAKAVENKKPSKDRVRLLEVENRRLKSKFAELVLDYNTLRAALVNEVKSEC